jgi:hypothetical protein
MLVTQPQNLTRLSLFFPSVRDGNLRGGARHREHETDDKPRAGARRLRSPALLLQPEADPALCRRAHPQQGRVGQNPVFFKSSPVCFFVFFWGYLLFLFFFIYLPRRESF